MENVDGYSVERKGDEVYISFYDIFGMGETYSLPVEDAKKIFQALGQVLGPW